LAVFLIFPLNLRADNFCENSKKSPNIIVNFIDYKISIDNSKSNLKDIYGDINAELGSYYKLQTEITEFENKFCMRLTDVEIDIGYPEFIIRIDKNYKLDSCEYNMVLKHEKEHLETYVNILEDKKDEIKSAFQNAVNLTKPELSDKEFDNNDMDKFINQIRNSADVKTLFNKIKIEEEIQNKKIDENPGKLSDCE
jgi:hypothetical protein